MAQAPAPEAAKPAVMDPGEVKTAAEYLAEERFAGADQNLGRRVFLQCRACHSLEADGAHRVGPNLHGVFGEPAAVKEGFNYSGALKESGVVWTPGTLEEWLVRPSSFVPGNKMAFAGIKRETDRTALLAYLLKETSAAPE
jgi:cytochrome c